MKTAADIIAKQEFKESYSDPKWRAFSEEIRALYAWQCRWCRATDKRTQVHHLFYKKGAKPWDYSKKDVILLCGDCHATAHELLTQFRELIFPRMSPQALKVLNRSLSVGLQHYDPLKLSYAIASLVASPNSIERFCRDFKA